MNLESARNAQEFCVVSDRDDQGRPSVVLVPGHQGRRYEVRVSRPDKHTMVCECVDPDEGAPCPGCTHGKVCYHVLAAVMKSASDLGYLHVFDSYQHAMSVEGGLGRLVVVKAKEGGGVAYTRFYRHKRKKAKVVIKVQKPVEANGQEQGVLFEQAKGPYDK